MIDINSETWKAIMEWSKREEEYALHNVRVSGLAIEDTEYLRGRLAVLADLRTLADEKPTSQAAPLIT